VNPNPDDDGDDADLDGVTVRPYDPDDDADVAGLLACKLAFERGLGAGTGGDDKADRYEAKLTDGYRDGYLSWVRRCVDEDPGCVRVAVDPTDADGPPSRTRGDEGGGAVPSGYLGYAFVLPGPFAFVWDAAVLNELFVRPAARGTGVADALLEAAAAHARGQDLPLDRLVLDVDRTNDRARAFYDRHGFDHWGEIVAREL
jgi:ribosomal protein S18 acetylase RimI-like enzyme